MELPNKSNSTLLMIFVLTFVICFSSVFSSSTCGHALMKRFRLHSQSGTAPMLKAEYDKLDDWNSIRILTDFSGLVSKHPESHHLTEKIKTAIIPKVMQVLSELFKVRRIKRITLNEDHCAGDYKIPKHIFHNNPKETDLIILVNYDQSGMFDKHKIEASAIHCFQDSTTKRPIVGLVTFRDSLTIKTEVDVDYLVWLTIHEISHVLLFNEDLYPSFMDKNLNPINIENIIYTERNKYNQKIDYVKTPKVMEVAKEHYKCNNLKGVPLEYNGGENAIGGHWSRRALNTDYMIGRSHGENLISPFTLAFFEDSGWYKADFSKSSVYFWGKNQGCDFLTKNCVKSSKIIKSVRRSFVEILNKHENKKQKKVFKKYRNSMEGDINNGVENISIQSTVLKVTTWFKKEFCEEINQPVCSMHNMFRGYCGARIYNRDLPEKDRNFSNARIGGFDIFVNHCPIVVENKFNQKFYGGSCRQGSQQDLLPYEKICPNCGCFVSSLSKEFKKKSINDVENSAWTLEVYSIPNIIQSRAACLEFNCHKGEIYLRLDEKDYHCPSNKTMRIKDYHGEVKCPSNKIMCHKKYNCKFGCTSIQ